MKLSVFNRISFRSKVLIMGVVPLAIIGAIIGLLSFYKASLVVRESSKRVLADTVNRVDVIINVKVRQINESLNAITGNEQLAQLIAKRGDIAVEQKAVGQLCEKTVGSMVEIQNVRVYIGQQPVYELQSGMGGFSSLQLSAFYKNAAERGDRAVWSDLETVVLDSGAKMQRAPVYKGIFNDDGDCVGLVVLELDPSEIGNSILIKQQILNSQITYITDRQGAVIYSNNSVYSNWRDTVMARYREGVRRFNVELDGASYYVCSQYNGLTGWVSFTMIYDGGLFPGAAELQRYIIFLVIVCIILAVFFLVVLSLAITTPLKRLDKGMKEVQGSNFTIQLPNDRKDEFGRLIDSFNFMVNRINILVTEVYHEKLAQRNAELEALQAQINPHFLYNTLDNINWMLIDRGEMDISSIVVALGKLMQYSMDTSNSMATLAAEYKNVDDYLKVQKNRLEDRLSFRLEIEPGLENIPVPKLILQPIVENAIKHGIEPCENGGNVLVRSYISAGKVHIQVADDGRGMSSQELDDYKKLFVGSGAVTCIGVRNVARRLQLHYNNRCSFLVDSTAAGGLSVTMVIPGHQKGGKSIEYNDY